MKEEMQKFEGAEQEISNELLMRFTPEGERWLKREEVELALVLLAERSKENDAVKELRANLDLPLNMAKAAFKAAEYINQQKNAREEKQ